MLRKEEILERTSNGLSVFKHYVPGNWRIGLRDEYLGQYDDEEDFAYEIIEECYDLPEFAKTYFDYEKFARDLFMCDYWFDDGFVFRAA